MRFFPTRDPTENGASRSSWPSGDSCRSITR
jgi:hypothetical protein